MNLIQKLKSENKTIATAESCTGGLLAKTITDLPGASEVFEFGAVVYSNKFKNKLLNVPEDILKNYGAVSSQTAESLAKGVCDYANSDIGVGITGIAGPGGGTDEKPVGLVYISVYSDHKFMTKKLMFNGTREKIRNDTVIEVFRILEFGYS